MDSTEELRAWVTARMAQIAAAPLPELIALRRAFGDSYLTAAEVGARPELVHAIGASAPANVGVRLRELKAVGTKGGLTLESGTRVRNGGLRWRVQN